MANRQGRPPKKADLVDNLRGEATQKQKLKIVLETITGDRSMESACEALSLSKAGFHELRAKVLSGALASLHPKLPGPKPAPREPSEVTRLKAENEQLKMLLEAEQIRTEIALIKPSLLIQDGKKKHRRRK